NNILYSNATTFTGNYPGKIYRILDIGGSATDGDLDLGIFSTVPFSHIKCSKYAPTGTSTLFVGTESGRLYKVLNAQNDADVSEIGSPDFPTASISSVSEGGSDDTLMVSFSNYGVSSIWQTYDGGTTWMEREGNLPDMPVRWAMYHPQNSGQALIATETGVWTTNMMHTENPDWYPANDGMGNVRVDMLRLRESDNMVIAASHGRGVFNGIWNVEVYTGTNDNKAKTASCTISPNPASDFVQIDLPVTSFETVSVSFYDANGMLVLDKKLSSIHDKISIQDFKTGTYVAVVNTGLKRYYAKFTKSTN
ncbi:MAG: T9SS type A sorting domain-containing protein, partial [Bacteroidales bacterium]